MTSHPRQIAFLCHPYHRGGVTRWMIDASEEFSRQGYTVYFITVRPTHQFISGANRPTMVSLLKSINSTFKIIAPSVGFAFELGTSAYRSQVYVNAILKNVSSKIPIIPSDDASVWDAASQLSGRNPMIGVLHSDDPYYYSLAKSHLQSVFTFVSVSRRIVENCMKERIPHSDLIPVIPCGIPFSSSPVNGNGTSVLKLVWVGRIEEQQKRISDLIKISLELRKENIQFHLNIIGHGSESAWLSQEIASHHLQSSITMNGWMDSESIYSSMKNSDFLLLTSNYEGMPVAVMEALSNGCGILSSRVSGVEDLENHPLSKNAVWIFSIGNISEAMQCIRKASAVPAAIRREAAQALATSEFSIQTCVERYITILGTIPKNFPGDEYVIPRQPLTGVKSYLIAILRQMKRALTKRMHRS